MADEGKAGTWEIRGRTPEGTKQAAIDSVAAMQVDAQVVAEVTLEAVRVAEVPAGHREFQGCRRWVLEEARKYRALNVDCETIADRLDAGIRLAQCEEIAKAMGDYWLGPEDVS